MSGPPKPEPVQVEVRKHYYRITGDEGLEESSDCPPKDKMGQQRRPERQRGGLQSRMLQEDQRNVG